MTKSQVSCRSLAAIAMFVTAVFIWSIAPAGASIVTFYGADNGVGPGGARPNSDNAAALFDLAVGGSPGIITFEGLPTGMITSPLTVAPGVTLTTANGDPNPAGCGGICAVNAHSPVPLGYNTTAGGRQHLRVFPFFNSLAGETVTFAFSNPITAFGAYLTDTQTGFLGNITVTFSDGAAQTLNLAKTNNTGGVLFFGFTDSDGLIASVSYHTGATGADNRDLWGIDDVHYSGPAAAVPEPATLALMGLGFAGLAASRRRKASRSITQCDTSPA